MVALLIDFERLEERIQSGVVVVVEAVVVVAAAAAIVVAAAAAVVVAVAVAAEVVVVLAEETVIAVLLVKLNYSLRKAYYCHFFINRNIMRLYFTKLYFPHHRKILWSPQEESAHIEKFFHKLNTQN